MRTVEDGQALRLLVEIAPVRVGLGDVAAEDEMISVLAGFFSYDQRGVRGEGAFVRGRDEDREWIRVHERDGVGVVADSEVFGDVHGFFS